MAEEKEKKIKVILRVEDPDTHDVYEICRGDVLFGEVKKIREGGKQLSEESQIKVYSHVDVVLTLLGKVNFEARS